MEDVAVATLRTLPNVARIYTRTQLEKNTNAGDRIDQRVRNGFNATHSGDVIVVHDPNWMNRPAGTTHGSPYSYDSHVPMIFWGSPALVRPGRYHSGGSRSRHRPHPVDDARHRPSIGHHGPNAGRDPPLSLRRRLDLKYAEEAPSIQLC